MWAANLIRSRATTHFKRFYSISKRLNPRRRCSLRVLMGFPFAHSRDHVPWRTTVAKWNITQDPAPSTPQQKKNKTRISPVSRRCTHDPHRSWAGLAWWRAARANILGGRRRNRHGSPIRRLERALRACRRKANIGSGGRAAGGRAAGQIAWHSVGSFAFGDPQE